MRSSMSEMNLRINTLKRCFHLHSCDCCDSCRTQYSIFMGALRLTEPKATLHHLNYVKSYLSVHICHLIRGTKATGAKWTGCASNAPSCAKQLLGSHPPGREELDGAFWFSRGQVVFIWARYGPHPTHMMLNDRLMSMTWLNNRRGGHFQHSAQVRS